jgi:hypothetical protein
MLRSRPSPLFLGTPLLEQDVVDRGFSPIPRTQVFWGADQGQAFEATPVHKSQIVLYALPFVQCNKTLTRG